MAWGQKLMGTRPETTRGHTCIPLSGDGPWQAVRGRCMGCMCALHRAPGYVRAR